MPTQHPQIPLWMEVEWALRFDGILVVWPNNFDPVCTDEGRCGCGYSIGVIHAHVSQQVYDEVIKAKLLVLENQS